jgi:hypothetical protein
LLFAHHVNHLDPAEMIRALWSHLKPRIGRTRRCYGGDPAQSDCSSTTDQREIEACSSFAATNVCFQVVRKLTCTAEIGRILAIPGRNVFVWQSFDRKRFELFRRRTPPFLRFSARGPAPTRCKGVRCGGYRIWRAIGGIWRAAPGDDKNSVYAIAL